MTEDASACSSQLKSSGAAYHETQPELKCSQSVDRPQTTEQRDADLEITESNFDNVGEFKEWLAANRVFSHGDDHNHHHYVSDGDDKLGESSPPSPTIQSNNLARQIQVMTLTDPVNAVMNVTDNIGWNLHSASADSNLCDSDQITNPDSSESIESSSSRQNLDVLEGIPSSMNSNSSSHVTTPDSGISCDK